MIPSLAPVSGESSMLKNPLFYVAAEAVIFGAASAYLYKKTSALSTSIVEVVDRVGRLEQIVAEQRAMIQQLSSVVISMQAQPVAKPKVASKPPPKRQASSPKTQETQQSSHPSSHTSSHPGSTVASVTNPNTGAASMMQAFPYMPSMVFISGRSHKNDTVIEEEEEESSDSENTLDAERDEELKELEEETEQ